ncbi:MAG: endonuclease MutS2, partial [Nitrospinaceae bacterium]|nr:endonuclease MutS2 [Nitrospinaceae bacterium]NIR56893.1 endonuclease MutS2 [Nitrospinaceae bacterium]NIS87354.1 endonuclease MutS2 [Nitrospinaceae bacterium]NIT84210.1 endonuclease MutS2 [Nitrospinaceae bacterium]NIU46394.1 endonuclease MutS2 [Nitrospinaceae bacterium]
FLEPTTIIPLNNQLKLSRLQVEHEKQKILQSLARQIGDHAEPLRANLNILVELDLVHARAQLGRALKATRCPLNREGRVKLLQARNPELILNGAEVVP